MEVACIDHLLRHKRIFIALSGGIDSMVLLDLLVKHPKLKPKLQVIHVNHGISPNAISWKNFCQQQCQQQNLPFHAVFLELRGDQNLEDRARNARYQAFLELTQAGDALVLAHHLDDQLETFWLNALRGTGLRGLAAMPLQRDFSGRIIYRPILQISRAEIRDYAISQKLNWIEDESNQNPKFSRNFLRLEILPRIQAHWPNYRESLSHTIADCQAQLELTEAYLIGRVPCGLKFSKDCLAGLSQAEVYTFFRLWCKKNQVSLPSRAILNEIWQQFFLPTRKDSNPWVTWGKFGLKYYKNDFYLVSTTAKSKLEPIHWNHFPKSQGAWEAILSPESGVHIDSKKDKIEIRYRLGGEVIFYRGHHRCLKKILQAMKVPPWLRQSLPLLYVNGELQGVLGYFYADQRPLQASQDCYQIRDNSK
jgi:tRNA(Ile)-lysidine synthase